MAREGEALPKLADIIQPQLFSQYIMDELLVKTDLIYSGVVENNRELNRLVNGGGTILTMPMWNDLAGESQVLTETDDIAVTSTSAKSEKATVLMRAHAWGAHELASMLAGDSVMKAITSRVANWWLRDEKRIILSILNGVFACSTMAALNLVAKKTSTDTKATKGISPEVILDAKQLLGDNSDNLSLIYMHSAVYTELQKQNAIKYVATSTGPNASNVGFDTYLGYRVMIDDDAPYDATDKVYTSYLLSRGCLQRGDGTPVDMTGTETFRKPLSSMDYLVNRRCFVLHPRGISWTPGTGVPAAPTPSNNELKAGDNWTRVLDIKKIGMVAVHHTLVDATA